MEELLKRIRGSKTFSIAVRKQENKNESNFDFDATERHGIDEIPAPMTVSSGKRPEIVNNKHEHNTRTNSSYSEFILNDRNVSLQRKILLQQEKLQKQSIASLTAASNTKKLNTMGLLTEDEIGDCIGHQMKDDVTLWPQYEHDVIYKFDNYYKKLENDLVARKSRRKSGGNRFWSAFFPSETIQNTSEMARKRRIFADPAYIIHLSILKVRDERESAAIDILKRRLASLSLLKKTDLKPLVNELFLRALDKGFDDLVIMLLDAGYPENINHSIYGDCKSRQFPSFLLLAIGLGRLKVVQKMLEIQPRVQLNRGWFNGIRPLMLAQMIKKVPGQSLLMTQLLLKHGAEANRSISYSTYMKGLTFRQSELLKSKRKHSDSGIKSRGRKEIYRNSRLYALDFACSREKFESAHLILSTKNSQDWLSKNEFCLLRLNDFELAADILQRSPDLIKQRDPRGNTPLHWAAKHGRTDLIALYLKYTNTIDVLNSMHWTPLHEAAAGAHRATVQYLISRGADCSIKNVEGRTALQVARENGISSEEIFDFFHSADTIQRTQQFLGQLTTKPQKPSASTTEIGTEPPTSRRLLIQKLMKYPRKIWKKNK